MSDGPILIVNGLIAALDWPATPAPRWSTDQPHPAPSSARFRVYNPRR